MRVLFSFPHAIGAPGVGWTAWNQAAGLAERGHDVHVVAASIARPLPEGVRITTTLAARGMRVPHRAIGRDRALAWHDRVASRLVRPGAYDLVHLWPFGIGATARAACAAGIPSVREAPNTHTAHAWRVVAAEVERLGLAGTMTTAHTENPVHLAREQADWDAVTAVLAPSDAVVQSFVEEGHAPDRILRHRYGFRPGTRRMSARIADNAPLRAVYVGLVEPRKGLHHALAAWVASTASEAGTFTVVGRMLQPYRAVLNPYLAHPSVRVVGFSSDVEAALAASDVLVLPTLEEGSALVTYEAQAAGCVPLVSTAAGAMLDDGVHGLLHEPGDVATLTAQLDRLAGDRGELARLSRAALAHTPDLTWGAAAEQLESAYLRAVALGPGRSEGVTAYALAR